MKKRINLAILLIFILTLNISACSKRNSPDVDKTTNENAKNTTQNVENHKVLTKEEYKQLLVKNYEKYLVPIDIKDETVEDLIDENNDLSNEKLIENYRNLLSDSRNNIQAFRESIKTIKIEDSNLQELNNNLVKSSDKVISDIIVKQDGFDSLSSDLLNGDKKALLQYLKNELNKDITNEKELDDTLEKIENILGIDLSK